MTEQRSFNLLREPWIPVLLTDGTIDELSLLDALNRSESVRSITGEVPTQAFALHRLLLAILHRALDGPRSTTEWARIRDDWAGTIASVTEYLLAFEDRFDLFHPTQPFFQVHDLRTAKGDVSGLERIIVDVPNGSPFLTTRVGRGIASISAAEAARWLVHVHAFDTSGIKSGALGDGRVKGGKGYPLGTGWAGQLGGIEVLGATLRETLLLNLVGLDTNGVDVLTGDEDVPPWERAPDTSAGSNDLTPRGLIDMYTWQSRRVRLVGEPDGVTGVVLAYGDKITPQNRVQVEPLSQWRFSNPQTKKFGHDVYMPREHDPERSFWRGLSALVPQAEQQQAGSKSEPAVKRPAVLSWTDKLQNAGLIPGSGLVNVHAIGLRYGVQSAVVDELVDDTLTVPAALLAEDQAELHYIALTAVTQTEDAAFAIAILARNLAAAAGAGDVDGHGDRAREQVYVELDRAFRRWLTELTPASTRDEALTSWDKVALRIVRAHADALIRATGPAAWVGRDVSGRHIDVGLAEKFFRAKLADALPHAYPSREEKSA